MKRRKFIQYSGLASGLGLLHKQAFSSTLFQHEEIKKLVILHTNDVHSHIEPFPLNDPKHPGEGGFAKRAALIQKIRSEEKNVLVLDAGDIFQGTPYFNFYGGELEFKLMSKMQYDAATLGNHDFDNGIEGLVKQLPHASFPFVNCNYDFRDTALHKNVKPFIIKKIDGLKVGILGVGVELDGLVDKRLTGEIQYQDPIKKANEIAKILKKEFHCNLVICLSHLGFEYAAAKVSDKILAASSENIDLIIGGHTHTFLNEPVSIKNKAGAEVLVNQVGWAGIYMGRLDYYFNQKNDLVTTHNDLYKIFRKTI
jgi:5'-nucleotidase